jgi:CrcB protein
MLVAVAAGLGAVLRYLVDRAVPRGALPWGTLVVNTTGSFALGVAVAGSSSDVLTVGVLGGYTTLSTYAVETVALAERSRWRHAALNVALSAVLGLLAAAAGLALGERL